MSSEKDFKLKNRPPACNTRPWAHLIPKAVRFDVLAKVRQECLALYGYDLDECPKRLVCFAKTCMGRPLEWLSPTAKPYLQEFAKIVGIKENEDYHIITDCSTCPIKLTCTSSCPQVNDFMNRDKIKEPQIDFRENLENIVQEPERTISIQNMIDKKRDVPWDALTKKRKETVEKYLYQQKDFLTISRELGYYNQAKAKYELYAALTTLAEYASMRKFYEENEQSLKDDDRNVIKSIYLDNMSITEVAKIKNISKQSVQQRVAKIIKNNGITWQIFVRKEGKKLIYNTLEVLK